MRGTRKLQAAARPLRRSARADGFQRSPVSVAVAAALCGAAVLPGGAAFAADSSASSEGLQEIVVTARKRTENLQDVPQSIDVFTSKDLQNLSISQFEDYATKTPSISFISIGPATQMFFMRGVSDGSNPNVVNTSSTGFFLDDMSLSYYGSIPDLHSYDMERIEVLNGPQGTLFGAGSMSGAVRLITAKPDPNAFSAGVDTDNGKIDRGGYNDTYEAFVNVPLIDGKTAIRISGYSMYNGGFIDNLLTTRHWVNGVTSTNAQWAGNDYNTQYVDGARVAIKQVITDNWNVVLTGSYQGERQKGAWDQDPKYGQREVSRFGPENGTNFFRSLDLHVEGDVGIGDLVFASTYWSLPTLKNDEYSEYVQYSPVLPFTAANIQSFACLNGPSINGTSGPYTGCKPPTMYYEYHNDTERWSNEVRLQSKAGSRIQWLAGLYWEHTKDVYSDFYHMPNIQPTGNAYQSQISYYNYYYKQKASPLPEEWYSYKERSDYWQTTEFADVTLPITERWSIEGGVQHFRSWFTDGGPYAGYFWDPKDPFSDAGGSHKVNAKAGVNFKVNKDLLLYASFGQGFRDGGTNPGLGATCYKNGAPQQFTPDTLNNFEVGWKSTLLNGRIVWDGAVYYMPWKNYQAPVFDLAICPIGFNANLGNARIYGSESNINYTVTEGLTLQVSASYNDSHLTTDTFLNPNFIVVPGERLPYVPYFNYSANARYERPLNAALKGFFQYDIAHKGDMWSDLRAIDPNGFERSLQPAYDISNVRFGVGSPGERWSAEAYVTNLFDKNAIIFTNTGNYDRRNTTNEPRVVGLRLSYRWGKNE